jgi:5-methylcytosine-specific restriction enzyme A
MRHHLGHRWQRETTCETFLMPRNPKNDRRGWYGSRRWRRLRALHLQRHPLCARCEAEGQVVAAEVVHHVQPHEGDKAKFYLGALQSLCRQHHEEHHSRGRAQWELDEDGWVVDAPETHDMRRLLTRSPKKKQSAPEPVPDPASLVG